jgi:asparagine synthase (glutamine-hydrolysing)
MPRCGLVHTRLAILDLSQAGHQPLSTTDGRYTIVFNGEIYNFRELRKRLAAHGINFRSESDTEVLLHLYVELGPGGLAELRGMFAFAIWDQRERSCFLARDPLGIKPLYYAQTPIGMIFASEVRAVLASGLVSRKLDAHSVCGFFQTGTVPEPATLVESVYALPAGASLLWKSRSPVLDHYWTINLKPAGPSRRMPSISPEAVLDSVRHHFVSDVPVGVFLSAASTRQLSSPCPEQLDRTADLLD